MSSTINPATNTEYMAQRIAKARRLGDEHLAQFLHRTWLNTLPEHGSIERRNLEAIYRTAYRMASGVDNPPRL